MNPTAASVASRLADLVGGAHVVTDPAALSAYRVDGLEPSAALLPGSSAEVADVLRFAAAGHLAVVPVGSGSKLGIGMPPRQYDLALDVSRMNRVLAYDPGDLTLGVEPGVRLADLVPHLAGERQFLPLAPPFAERATLGGIIAAGCDGPLRHGYGTARDCLLGMEFVTGAGVASKSGGRVVKNVTGYDLHRPLVGSLGTLAVITRINFRTFPVAPEHRIFLAYHADGDAALAFCARLAESQLQLRMVEVLNPAAARMLATASRSGTSSAAPGQLGEPKEKNWSVAVGVSGHQVAVERHARELDRLAREARAVEFTSLDEAQSDALLQTLAEFPRFTREASPAAAIFRIAVMPSAMPALLRLIDAVAQRRTVTAAILARAVGVVHTALLPSSGTAAAPPASLISACRELMDAAISVGLLPTIEWAPPSLKLEVNVWPPSGDELSVAQRLKKVFDPHGVLAPGRFRGGI